MASQNIQMAGPYTWPNQVLHINAYKYLSINWRAVEEEVPLTFKPVTLHTHYLLTEAILGSWIERDNTVVDYLCAANHIRINIPKRYSPAELIPQLQDKIKFARLHDIIGDPSWCMPADTTPIYPNLPDFWENPEIHNKLYKAHVDYVNKKYL